MDTVFPALLRELQMNHSSMLVVITEDDGSSPRGKGAVMLAGTGGRIAGTIGGGALEKKAEEEARRLLSARSSGTREYRLRQNEDVGMACGGSVRVLFQLASAGEAAWAQVAEAALERMRAGRPGWLLLRTGGLPALLDEDKQLLAGAEETAGAEGAFSIPLPVKSRAILFGGGHIALELAPILKQVGFRVVVFDDRPEFSGMERFPMAEQTVCGSYEDIEAYLALQEDDYVVVITEGHRHDFAVERQALRHPLSYIGAIGSRTKTAAVNQRLLESGFQEADIRRIHAPIGTAIKAVTPAEIAVSIAGEMILVRAERREREGKSPVR